MKNYSIVIIIFLLGFFCNINKIGARDIKLSCKYGSSIEEKQISVLCDIYEGNKHQCYMEVGGKEATSNSNKEDILNWEEKIGGESIQDYVKGNDRCPSYLVVRADKAIAGYDIYAFSNENKARKYLKDRIDKTGWSWYLMTHSISGLSEVEQQVIDMTNLLNDKRNNFSFANCYYKELNRATNLKKYCIPELEALQDMFKYKETVDNLVASGTIERDNQYVKNFYTAFTQFEDFVNQAMKCAQYQLTLVETNGTNGEIDEKFVNMCIGNIENGFIVQPPDLDKNEATGSCDILGENVTPIVKWVFKIIRFLIPLLIIILTMVDFAGVVLSGEDKNFKEVWKKLVKRLLIGVAVIFAPMILTYLIDISGILNQYGIDKNQLFCSIY